MHLGALRRLVGRVDAGEILELAGLGLGIEALGVAGDAVVDRGIDEYLDELAVGDEGAHHVALGAVGRNERAQHDEPALHHELRHFADAADVLDAVGLGEAEVAVEAVAHVVAIEQHGVMAGGEQALLDDVGDGRFAGAREAGEPDDGGPLLLERSALRFADEERLPMDVSRAAQAEGDHAGANGAVRIAVDDDERAGLAVLRIGIEGDRRSGRDVAEADIVEAERVGGEVLLGVDVDAVFDGGDARRDGRGADPCKVGAARN